MLKCKVFVGAPKNTGVEINTWLESIQVEKDINIVNFTQSFEETHGNMILTIFYYEFDKGSMFSIDQFTQISEDEDL